MSLVIISSILFSINPYIYHHKQKKLKKLINIFYIMIKFYIEFMIINKHTIKNKIVVRYLTFSGYKLLLLLRYDNLIIIFDDTFKILIYNKLKIS